MNLLPKNNFFQQVLKKGFRLTFFHDDFKPVFSFRFTIFSLFLWLIGYATVIILITMLIISKTNLKEYIPGYGTVEERKQMLHLTLKMDSLQTILYQKNLYLNSILKVLKEERDSIPALSNKHQLNQNVLLKANTYEKVVRQEIEQEIIQYRTLSGTGDQSIQNVQFLPPAKGIVISQYDPKAYHFGIDVLGKADEPVRCVDKGVVIYADYSVRDGNCVSILHPFGFVSVYKHLSVVLKRTGDYVNANDLIGMMGNTGSESTGVHLHFELWYYQKAVDPLHYIVF